MRHPLDRLPRLLIRTLIRCEEAQLAANPMLVHFAKQTVWEMAQPYADQPGYREERRP